MRRLPFRTRLTLVCVLTLVALCSAASCGGDVHGAGVRVGERDLPVVNAVRDIRIYVDSARHVACYTYDNAMSCVTGPTL